MHDPHICFSKNLNRDVTFTSLIPTLILEKTSQTLYYHIIPGIFSQAVGALLFCSNF